MTRRTKIIVSISGIFIILLALIGITYGYFLTRVKGNTNDKSILVTTANLSLIYDDGTVNLLTKDNVIPGMTVATKDFTVRNNGTGYIDEYRVYLEDVINDFKYYEDVKLSITCTSKLKDGKEKECNGYQGVYPKENSELIFNSIEVGETHSYELSVEYIETDSDQSDDMNKTIEGKVQIYVPEDIIAVTGNVDIVNPIENASYFIEMQSTPKKSQIVNDTYIIHGITPGNHTIYVKYIDENGYEQIASSKSISIEKGENPSISSDGTNIIINELSEKATINVNAKGTTITTTGEKIETINNFEEGTLAYNILDKAIVKTGSSYYYVNPAKSPAKIKTSTETTTLTELAQSEIIISSNKDLIEKIFIGQDINEEFLNKCFTFENEMPNPTNAEGCGDLDIYLGDNSLTCDKISNKYFINPEILHIFRVKTCNQEKIELEYSTETVALLSKVADDYGISYYYKGNIQDNYVDFAGMCWRIVRIEGDGSTKLILEDQGSTCKTSNGDWAIPTTTGGSTILASYGEHLEIGCSPKPSYCAIDPGHDPDCYGCNEYRSYGKSYLNSSIESMAKAFMNFQTGPLANYIDRLKSGNWCDVISNNANSFRCESNVMNDWGDEKKTPMYVGTINGAEYSYSRSLSRSSNATYLTNGNKAFWLLSSPADMGYGFSYIVETSGEITHSFSSLIPEPGRTSHMRPAVSLKPGTMITSGVGTKDDAYKIN